MFRSGLEFGRNCEGAHLFRFEKYVRILLNVLLNLENLPEPFHSLLEPKWPQIPLGDSSGMT